MSQQFFRGFGLCFGVHFVRSSVVAEFLHSRLKQLAPIKMYQTNLAGVGRAEQLTALRGL